MKYCGGRKCARKVQEVRLHSRATTPNAWSTDFFLMAIDSFRCGSFSYPAYARVPKNATGKR